MVVSRTLLQSMPETWQATFVDLLYRHYDHMNEIAADMGPSQDCKVEAGAWNGEQFTPLHRDPVPHYNRGRTRVEPRL